MCPLLSPSQRALDVAHARSPRRSAHDSPTAARSLALAWQHLGFPLPTHLRTGRASFSGGGRGLSYEGIAKAVRDHAGFATAPAVFGGTKQLVHKQPAPKLSSAGKAALGSSAVHSARFATSGAADHHPEVT
jgi:hypothetical protein